jgi:protein-disulfide isomerase
MNAKREAEHAVAAFILFTLAAPAWAQVQNTTNCPQLQDTTKSMLVSRVRARYQAEPAAVVQLTDDSLVAGSCYHRLIFEIQSARQSYSLPLYLSPDQRYLTRDLTEVRPANSTGSSALANAACATPTTAPAEARATASLVDGSVTATGSATAPATLVVFSDFQCPYCKRSAEWLKAETQQFDAKQLRVVYRFFPLSFHPWAKPAAEAAACVAAQSPAAFWKFHDAIFANQASINPGNVQDKLSEFAQGVAGLKMADYKKCVESGQSAQTVQNDQRLGASVQVRGTPTMFLNGKQIGLQSPAQLHAAIEDAVKGPVQVAKGTD